ncbi:MAG: hypothetical protein ACP5UL_03645 [Thermoplasmata archaeon]
MSCTDCIYVEGKRDGLLITSLGFGRKSYIVADGKFKVLKSVGKSTKCVVGIIDEDPGSLNPSKDNGYLKEVRKCERYHFTVYIYKNDNCKVIIELEEILEGWIIGCAGNDLLSKFNIPMDYNNYHRKPINTNEEQFMKEFADSECAKELKNIINLFISSKEINPC